MNSPETKIIWPCDIKNYWRARDAYTPKLSLCNSRSYFDQ